jgi:hypothetical protein
MFFSHIKRMNKDQTTRSNSIKSLAPACLGLASIFLVTVFMSGCVVHHPGHGFKQGHGKGHAKGHHKGKIIIKPKAEISISPLIVIDD